MAAPDYDQIAADLAAALGKTASSGIMAYTVNGRNVMYNNPELLLRALEKAQAAAAISSATPATTYAEVED